MITKEEVKAKARELEVGPINVQRDFVFGWLLFAIYSATELGDILILKGGNCLRKAFFEHTRYSGDLDFGTEVAVDPELLRTQLNIACKVAQEAAGVVFDLDESRVVEGWSADKDQHIYKARLYFQDFFGNREGVLITVRLDITEFDKIYLPTQSRNLIHSYSDQSECRATMRCISLEEALAAKLKCLLQRKHIVDLYDFAYSVFVRRDIDVDRGQIASVFLKKTIFEPSPRAAISILTGLPLEKLESAWQRFIVCPKQSILDFGSTLTQFREMISELFGGLPNRSSALAFFPSTLRNPIMEAGSSLTVLNVVYDGHARAIEPYSLVFKRRKDGVGREYFYAYDRTGGRSGSVGIKTFVADKFESIENTEEKFEPREEVVISKAGEPGDALYFGNQSPFYKRSTKAAVRSARFGRPSWVFTVQCPICQRRFERATRSAVLRPHKDSFGNRCYGRRAMFVSQEMR